MAFKTKRDATAPTNKQHLNLSVFAFETIQSDMFAFGTDNMSGFLNRVIEHFHESANASVSWKIRLMEGELKKLLDGIVKDSAVEKKVIRKLSERRAAMFMAEGDCYESGEQFKFWLNAANIQFLTEDDECREEVYYSTRGKYIKCLIEEYARRPYVQRERIYFRPFVGQIDSAIHDRKRLKIVTGTDRVYSFAPYRLMTDSLSAMNYLVGYGQRYDDPDSEWRPYSLRLSALKEVKEEKSKPAGISKEMIRELEEMLRIRGVQFMAGRETEIRVRLSKDGLARYRRYLHLRPKVSSTDGDVLIFHCTPAQAEFYFFKFGADAEIIEPKWLREKFIGMYRTALDTYEQKTESLTNDEV